MEKINENGRIRVKQMYNTLRTPDNVTVASDGRL